MTIQRGEYGSVNVIGGGPNGLAAAVVLARAGIKVRLFEAASSVGGGARTKELIEPGTWHDVCSAVHPAAYASEFFRRFELTKRVDFITPEVSYAQPMKVGPARIAYRSIDRTATELGWVGAGWKRVFGPLARRADDLAALTMGHPLHFYRQPATAVRLGLRGAAQLLAPERASLLRGGAADLFSGVAAHSAQPLHSVSAVATGLVLATYGHAYGWPIPVGGSQRVVDAMAADARNFDAELETDWRVDNLAALPPADATIFDTSLATMLRIGADIPGLYRRRAARQRIGVGVGKVDLILSGPIPWRDPRVAGASTVHLGGQQAAVASAERIVLAGGTPESPYVLVSQPTTFDPQRTASGQHVVWAYTHLPYETTADVKELIISQIEAYAPGFRDLIIGSAVMTPADVADYNANYVRGDIYSGALSPVQLLARPVLAADPWRVARTNSYLCSSAAVPGPGVHGMGGLHAAMSVLRNTYARPDELPHLGTNV